MEAYLYDIALLFCYLSCSLWGAHKKTMEKTSLYCFLGATVCFLTAWTIIKLPPIWFHLIIASVCFCWGYVMVKYCSAIFTAITIGAFGLFQALYSVDWYLNGSTPTGLSKHYETIAIAFHLLIMATYTNGLVLYSRTSSGTSRRSTSV